MGVPTAADNYARLLACYAGAHRVIVAFSGGVDSGLVLKSALDALGADRVLGVHAVSPAVPTREREEALATAQSIGADVQMMETHELKRPGYVQNGPDRCYHCKSELYDLLGAYAVQRGYSLVLDGMNLDDAADNFRPGQTAARERGVRSPLVEAKLRKADVREIARAVGLRIWDKPAAPCLSSRVPYGTAIEPGILSKIEAAEDVLARLGFREFRVRHHGNVARIEIPAENLAQMTDESIRQEVVQEFRRIGYSFVTLDLAGFASGSLNRLISDV